LALELWGRDSAFRGSVAPIFYDRGGEQVTIPAIFMRAIYQTVAGACCVGCRHSHVLVPPQETNKKEAGQKDGETEAQAS